MYQKSKSKSKRLRSPFIARLQSDTTSSRTFSFYKYTGLIQMAKCHSKVYINQILEACCKAIAFFIVQQSLLPHEILNPPIISSGPPQSQSSNLLKIRSFPLLEVTRWGSRLSRRSPPNSFNHFVSVVPYLLPHPFFAIPGHDVPLVLFTVPVQ